MTKAPFTGDETGFRMFKVVWVVKIARMTMGVGEMEDPLVQFNNKAPKKSSNLAGFLNLVLMLMGLYVVLFLESIARWLLLFVIIAVYFFQNVDYGS